MCKPLKLGFLPLGIRRALNDCPAVLSSVVSVPFWTMIQFNGMFAEEKDQEGERTSRKYSSSIPMTKLSLHSQASPSG